MRQRRDCPDEVLYCDFRMVVGNSFDVSAALGDKNIKVVAHNCGAGDEAPPSAGEGLATAGSMTARGQNGAVRRLLQLIQISSATLSPNLFK